MNYMRGHKLTEEQKERIKDLVDKEERRAGIGVKKQWVMGVRQPIRPHSEKRSFLAWLKTLFEEPEEEETGFTEPNFIEWDEGLVEENGELVSKTSTRLAKLSCGCYVTTPEEIGGECSISGGTVCKNCLVRCDECGKPCSIEFAKMDESGSILCEKCRHSQAVNGVLLFPFSIAWHIVRVTVLGLLGLDHSEEKKETVILYPEGMQLEQQGIPQANLLQARRPAARRFLPGPPRASVRQVR